MTKTFVGSFSDKPELKTLTHTPENYDHSELASLNDVIKLVDVLDCSTDCFAEEIESGGRIELKEGVFFPFWGTKILIGEEYRALFLKEEATGENFVIWYQ